MKNCEPRKVKTKNTIGSLSGFVPFPEGESVSAACSMEVRQAKSVFWVIFGHNKP